MSKVAKAAAGLMVVTILSKILGLFREQVLAAAYGTQMYAAAYSTANSIPIVLFSVIGSAIATSLIPMYNKLRQESGEHRALEFTNTLVNLITLICLAISIIGAIFTEPLVKLFAAGYTGEILQTTVNFTRILLFSIIFIGLANIMTGFLQIKNNFLIPGLIGIPYTIVIVLSIYLSLNHGIYVLIYGTLIALAFKFLFQVPFAYKKGYRYSLKINLKDEGIKEMMILIMPVVIGIGVSQLNIMIDRSLASTLGTNIVASFGYANKLYEFVQALFVTSILSVMYPKLASLLVQDDMSAFKFSLRKTMNVIIILIVPIIVGAVVLAVPIVKVLLQRGKFTYEDTLITANILKIYTVGILAVAIRDVMARGFYSLHDSKTPMTNGVIAILINILLNLIFINFMGYKGLALASTIAGYIGLLLFYFSLKNKIGNFEQREVFVVFIKSLIAASIMGIFSKFIFNYISKNISPGFISDVISLGSSVGIGVIVYFITIYLFKVEELRSIIDMIKCKFKK